MTSTSFFILRWRATWISFFSQTFISICKRMYFCPQWRAFYVIKGKGVNLGPQVSLTPCRLAVHTAKPQMELMAHYSFAITSDLLWINPPSPINIKFGLFRMWKDVISFPVSSSFLCWFSRSVVSDSFATPWTIACQAPLSMGFPRWEYWSGLPFPSPVILFRAINFDFELLACSKFQAGN